jgi:hypothetical protein
MHAAVLLLTVLATGSGYQGLGQLEREAVDDALAARRLEIDPAPEGKRVDWVWVVNLDIFVPRDQVPLLWVNYFHRTTREQHIRRESLLQVGDVYRQALADETMRNLQDPALSNVVVVLPVKTRTPESVDVLIVTRDVLSIRLNQDFEYQAGQLIYYTASLSENNFMGWRKTASVAFVMRQGDMSFGPDYVDPNVLGSRLKLLATFNWIWARQVGRIAAGPSEGSSSRVRLEYPLYSLASRWGAFTDFSHFIGAKRQFYGADLATIALDDPNAKCGRPASTPSTSAVPCVFRDRSLGGTSGVTRSFASDRLVQRLTLGHELTLRRTSLPEDFPADPALAARFTDRVLPADQRTSVPTFQYEVFTPNYRVYRDLVTFDFREDQRLGPHATLKLGRALEQLGSDFAFTSLAARADWAGDAGDGLQSIAASWEARVRGSDITDQVISARTTLATPVLARTLRLVASGEAGFIVDDKLNRGYSVGGHTGLRGYPVGAFGGLGSHAYYLAHFEARTMPLKARFLRLGGLAFFDAGHAAASARELALYEDVGVGIRLLLPHLNTYTLRADWAFPLRPLGGLPAGWPGRASFGFHQVF